MIFPIYDISKLFYDSSTAPGFRGARGANFLQARFLGRWVGALLQLAQDLEQMPPDVGSLPPSQLRGVHGVQQFLLYTPVTVDGRQACRDRRHR